MENNTINATAHFLELKEKMEQLETEIAQIQDERQKLIWKNLAGAMKKEDFDGFLSVLDEREAQLEYRQEVYLEELRELMH